MIYEISQFQVGSYIHDNTQINFSGKYEQNIYSLFLFLLPDMSTMLRTNGHSSTSWSVSTWVPTIRSSTGPTSHSHKPASRYLFLFFFSFPGTCSLWNILLNFWRDLLKLFEKLGWPRNWSSGIFTNRALSSLKTLKEPFFFDNMNSAKYLFVSVYPKLK